MPRGSRSKAPCNSPKVVFATTACMLLEMSLHCPCMRPFFRPRKGLRKGSFPPFRKWQTKCPRWKCATCIFCFSFRARWRWTLQPAPPAQQMIWRPTCTCMSKASSCSFFWRPWHSQWSQCKPWGQQHPVPVPRQCQQAVS